MLFGGNLAQFCNLWLLIFRNDDFSEDPFHMTSTPSPSDSGIAGNYELVLKEKDEEIANLRKTMERNENVIFKVHEEKEVRIKFGLILKKILRLLLREEGFIVYNRVKETKLKTMRRVFLKKLFSVNSLIRNTIL